MTTDIRTHVEAGVMTITLNRLERKNSITAAMYGAMADGLATAQEDAAVRVVVLQGHETVFSAGNDIGDFLNKPPSAEGSPVFRFLSGIATFPKPLLAAVCGPAVGVGTTMLLHCDLVYAGDNAAFSMPFVNLGLCPEAASSFLLPKMLGYHRAGAAADRSQQLRASPGAQAGRQADLGPGGNQAPDEEGPAAGGGAADGRRRRELPSHAGRAGCEGSLHRVHGEAEAGFFESLGLSSRPNMSSRA